MDHARREATNCREFLISRDCPIRLHSIRDFLADGDDVSDLARIVGPHRNLADDPVTDVAFRRWCLLLDAFDLTAFKHTRELFLEYIARLSREHFKNILPEH